MSAKRKSAPRIPAPRTPAPRTPAPGTSTRTRHPAPAPSTQHPAPGTRSVVLLASEARPFAKTGGLADVLGALPPALARLGWRTSVVLPKYRGTRSGSRVDAFAVGIGGFGHDVVIEETPLGDGAIALLVDCPDLFDRESLYGPNNTDYPDNPRRFALLCRAALEYIARQGKPSRRPAHSRLAGSARAGVFEVALRRASGPWRPQNGDHHSQPRVSGNFPPDWMPRLDLGWDEFRIDRMEFWGQISFLKGGINAADWITTVSPRYAEEIQTRDGGFGFDGIVRARRDRLAGILNGIDTRRMGPVARSSPAETVRQQRSIRESCGKAELLAAVRTAGGSAGTGAAADRHGVADGGPEGARPDCRNWQRTAAARHHSWCWVRAIPGIRISGGACRLATRVELACVVGFNESLAHLVEAGRRYVPDAVAVRAVRVESDVQPSLRDDSDRPGGRRACRHGPRRRNRLCVPRAHPRLALGNAPPGLGSLHGPAGLAGDAGPRNGGGPFLGSFCRRVRQNI